MKALTDPIASTLNALDLSELTPFAVESRYDTEFWPDQETSNGAVEQADRVLSLVSELFPANDSAPDA